tara:strand:- start:307 stop:471 length:165 start_codon:yes stop_codon:yes gene_type:complete
LKIVLRLKSNDYPQLQKELMKRLQELKEQLITHVTYWSKEEKRKEFSITRSSSF